jgi:nuclear distribution protein NudE
MSFGISLMIQREMDNLRSERDKTLVALRDLEMGNDELERNERYG